MRCFNSSHWRTVHSSGVLPRRNDDAAGAADLPLKAGPAFAVPQATGYVEVYGGWASTKTTGYNYDGSDIDSFNDSMKGKGGTVGLRDLNGDGRALT